MSQTNKPTRCFTICTGPIVVANDTGIEIIQPALTHEIRGNDVKYIAGQGPDAFFHIVDAQGSVVFACPTHLVLWSKQEKPASLGKLKEV